MLDFSGSLRYDMHGRKRKTKALSKPKKYHTKYHTPNFDKPVNRNKQVLQEYKDKYLVKSAPLMSDYDRAKEMQREQERKMRVQESSKYTIAPAYNKGAYQVIPRQCVKDIGR